MLNSPQKQRGIALITVLMILAIMVTIASTMTGRLTRTLKRTEGIVFSQSVYWYGQAAGDLGRMTLNQDFSDNGDVVSLDQNWAAPEIVFSLDNGNIAGEFKDLRSCFNLNSLGVKDTGTVRAIPVNQFKTLLEALGINDYAAEMIAESTRDWVDKDDQSNTAQGAEDSIYQARAVPHLAGNNLMVEVSELRAVQGVGQQVYDLISPYLCAIPESDQQINVNTVKIEQAAILYALFEGDNIEGDNKNFALSDFTQLLEDRPVSGWNSVEEFLASSLFTESPPGAETKNQLSVTSEYFQLNGAVKFEERIIAVQILFKMDQNKAKVIRYQSGGLK